MARPPNYTMLTHSLFFLLIILFSLTPLRASAKYEEVTHPLPTDTQIPRCSLTLLNYDIVDARGVFGGVATNESCSPPWSTVVVKFSASSSGEQPARVIAVWVGDVEILRTSTVETTESETDNETEDDALWTVKKDVTKYASVITETNTTTTLLVESVRNDVEVSGVLKVSVTLHFYEGTGPPDEVKTRGSESLQKEVKDSSKPIIRLPSENVEMKKEPLKSSLLYEDPADKIISVSDKSSASWFKISSGFSLPSSEIKIPQNAYRAVLEVCVSSALDDELWYSRAPHTAALEQNNLTLGRVSGAFREVIAFIDNLYVGSFVPFPIVYSGGIIPMFWKPIVAIGAFNLPSYDLDLTPFLGYLNDGKPHLIRLKVADATSVWLVNANLHLWLDKDSPQVEARLVHYRAPKIIISRRFDFNPSGGFFRIAASRDFQFKGWVNTSSGYLTTGVNYTLQFKNRLQVQNNGDVKQIEQRVYEVRMQKVEGRRGRTVATLYDKRTNPLQMQTQIQRSNRGSSTQATFMNQLVQRSNVVLPSGVNNIQLQNKQECQGRTPVQGTHGPLLSDVVRTEQRYSYSDMNTCYHRNLMVNEGNIIEDQFNDVCSNDA